MKSKDLRLLLSMGSSRKLFFGALLGAFISTSIIVANAFLIASVIVGIIYKHPSLSRHIAELAALWFFRAIFTSQFDHWASREAALLKARLRAQLLSSPALIISTPSSQLSALLIKGANSLDIYLARFLPQMFAASFTPFVVIVALVFLDPTSAAIAVLTLPIIPIFGALIGKYTNDAVSAKWQSLGTLAKYFEDSLRGLHTLAIFGRHRSQGARIQEMGDRYTGETMKVLRISFLSALVLELAATISVALIAVSIGIRLVAGSMEFFPALTVLLLAPEVYLPLRNAASLFHASADGGAALSELVEIERKSPTKIAGGDLPLERVSTLEVKSWSSPFGGGQLPAISAQAGDVLIIRGGSGLGKSTFLNSLIGINHTSEVLINGVALTEYSQRALFNQVGWIPQNPHLITGTIRDQFSLLPGNFSDAEITAHLQHVGLAMSALPQGLDTRIGGVGEKSGEISGGQRRRIAIARALAINPSLIIADEVSADLDPASAQEILQLMHSCAQSGAIVVVVLHAPDQRIDGADEIVMAER